MNAIELTIRPEKQLIPTVLSAVRCYAEPFFDDGQDVEQIALATEEAINNVLSYSLTIHLESITITANCGGGEFCVCVLDKGLPGNYEVTLQGEDRLGLTLMHGAMDAVSVENLGQDGRCQRLIKYCSHVPDLDKKKVEDAPGIQNAQITVRTPLREEMVEISRLLYHEYGMSYINDIVYFPERFFAAVEEDRIYSTVAVDQNGRVTGHHAVFQWDSIPGVWEGGMAVVDHAYHNAGIFTKMMERSDRYGKSIGAPLFLGGCITTHPYTQKLRLKYGNMPCGFSFNVAPPDSAISTFRKGDVFTSEAFACKVGDRRAKEVWLPEELKEIAGKIYGNLGLERTIHTEMAPPPEGETRSKWAFHGLLRNGAITISHLGADCVKRFQEDLYQMKRQGAEMTMAYVPIDRPGVSLLYEAAKKEGFFFTGLFPATGYGDMLLMQKILNHVVDYDVIVTTGPFTELLEAVRSLDPDQKKG